MNPIVGLEQRSGAEGVLPALPEREAGAVLAARNDVDAVVSWLRRVESKPATFDSYRREAERFLLWLQHSFNRALKDVSVEDVQEYQRFLKSPSPTEKWVMSTKRKYGRGHPEWRPFAGPLSPASQAQALTILSSLFRWLVDARYLSANPFALLGKSRLPSQGSQMRYLSDDLWAECTATVSNMPHGDGESVAAAARARWIFSLLYLSGMRISEVAGAIMGAFVCKKIDDGSEQWWLCVTGKGDRARQIPVGDDLLTELKRYRLSSGLAPLPSLAEQTPLVISLKRRGSPVRRSALHVIVKTVFFETEQRLLAEAASLRVNAGAANSAETAAAIHNDADTLAARAAIVGAASAHWVRHTAGSNMLRTGGNLLDVRDNLGHSSISTTNRYLHTSDQDRHARTVASHRIRWADEAE